MKKMMMLLLLVALLVLTALPAFASTDEDSACWGQATAVYTQLYDMGEHASSQETPRVGLRNLARDLYEDGGYGLEDDSIQALGAFVASSLGLSIDACM